MRTGRYFAFVLAASIATLGLTPIGTSTAHAGIPASGSTAPQQRAAIPLDTSELLAVAVAEAKKLTASDPAADDEFGFAAAISGDTIVVGAWNNDGAGSDAGAAYVFERDQGGANNWGFVKKLTASDAADNDSFGKAVSIDGDRLVVGAPATVNFSTFGAAYVFERNEGGSNNWGEKKKLLASDAWVNDKFGTAVAISGTTVLVGSPRNDDSGESTGSAYFYERNQGGTGNWGQIKKVTASDRAAGDWLGYSVGLDGNTAVIGALLADGGVGNPFADGGAAYVFDRDLGGANNWGERALLTPSDAAEFDEFGVSVGISGDTVIVGSNRNDDAGEDSGSAYMFERNQGGADNWGETKKLTASNAAAGDEFGIAVAVSGDTAVVAAYRSHAAGADSGSAYRFGRNQGGSGNWGESNTLAPSDLAAGDEFGRSVAISGDTAIVGARFEDGGPGNPLSQAGAAYIFDKSTGGFVLDVFGGLHVVGTGVVPINPAPPYFGFDVARDAELSGNGAHVLDGFGGLHAAGGEPTLTPQPPYFGFDIAKDVELAPGGGAYALDGFGGVHPVGGAPVLSPSTPYFGFDAARDMELGGGGYYVLDAWGGLHAGAGATPISPGPPYFGFDISKDLELAAGGGGYALDGFGGVHALGGAPVLSPATPYLGFDVARDLELDPGGNGHYVLDGFGGLHAGGGAAALLPAPPYFGFDAARDLELR